MAEVCIFPSGWKCYIKLDAGEGCTILYVLLKPDHALKNG